VYRLARRAALDRDEAMLAALDAVLEKLRVGVVVGAERELRDILSGDPRISDLERWLGDWPDPGYRPETAGDTGNILTP
jgi:hypothetical protein